MTLKKFMWLDTIILSILAIVVDVVAFITTSKPSDGTFLNINMFVAPGIVIIYLIYIRWGLIGIIPNLLITGLNLILYSKQLDNNIGLILIFTSGYLVWGLTLLVRKIFKTGYYSTWYITPFVFLGIYLIQILTESLMSVLVGQIISLEANILKHLVNMILSFIILVIITNQKKLVVDMKYELLNREEGV